VSDATPATPDDMLAGYVGKDVVLDTGAPLVFLGRLAAADTHFFRLTDVDVHDMAEGHTTKERYVLEARKYGVRKNRAEVLVRRAEVISLSRLEDVVEY
jgi:hypothetical protein